MGGDRWYQLGKDWDEEARHCKAEMEVVRNGGAVVLDADGFRYPSLEQVGRVRVDGSLRVRCNKTAGYGLVPNSTAEETAS